MCTPLFNNVPRETLRPFHVKHRATFSPEALLTTRARPLKWETLASTRDRSRARKHVRPGVEWFVFHVEQSLCFKWNVREHEGKPRRVGSRLFVSMVEECESLNSVGLLERAE